MTLQETVPNWRRSGYVCQKTGSALPPIHGTDPILRWGRGIGITCLAVLGVYLWSISNFSAAASVVPPLALLLWQAVRKTPDKHAVGPGSLFLLALGGAHLTLVWTWHPGLLLLGFPMLVAAYLTARPTQANLYAILLISGGIILALKAPDQELLTYFPFAMLALWICQISMSRTFDKMRLSTWKTSITDPLTGAFNRRLLEQYFQDPTQSGRAAMMLLDMDDFKSLNDQHGHAAGDRALARLAKLIRVNWASEVVCFRLGGDEFLLMMQLPAKARNVMSEREQDRHLARLGRSILNSLNNDGSFSASAGMARFSWPCDFEDVYRQADAALYQAKDLGGRQLSLDDSLNDLS